LTARRKDRLDDLAEKLRSEYKVKVFTYSLDVRDRTAYAPFVAAIPTDLAAVDVLVLNAGLALSFARTEDYNPVRS